MLSHSGREEFERLGLLRLPAAIPATEVSTMRDRFWEFLSARHGIQRDRVDTWTLEHPRHLQALRRSGCFDAMGTAEVCGALDDLLGPANWLHTPAPNGAAVPRMMLVEIVDRG